MASRYVYTFSSGRKRQVRFCFRVFGERLYFDVRVFFCTDQGVWMPTRRGLALPVVFFGEFLKGVRALEAFIEGEGTADE